MRTAYAVSDKDATCGPAPPPKSCRNDLYKPLNRSRREIRLFHFLLVKLKPKIPKGQDPNTEQPTLSTSGDRDPLVTPGYEFDNSEDDNDYAGPIVGQLTTVLLDDNPSYIALSYTWGNPLKKADEEKEKKEEKEEQTSAGATHTPRQDKYPDVNANPYILLNGHRLEVGQNLHNFSMHLWRLVRKLIRDDRKSMIMAGGSAVEACDLEICPFHGTDSSAVDCKARAYLRSMIPNCESYLSPAHSKSWLTATVPRLTLWIDAICINQDDVFERNHQVRLMGDLYRSATSVLSWLGADRQGQLVTGLRASRKLLLIWSSFKEVVALMLNNSEE